ncbi:MAG: type II toxin-antitoxin system VapC family toxin [Lacipirellulaceae bacterium]
MTLLLVDTGAIVAAMDRSSPRHAVAADALTSLSNDLVTCEPVLTEASFLLQRAGLGAAVYDLLEGVAQGFYRAPLRLADRANAVSTLMRKYDDRPMSLADACLVDLASELRTGRIATLDSDFGFYRWGKNRAFDLVLDPR